MACDKYVSENDFIKKFGLPDDHCNSCHEDADAGYYPEMIEVQFGDFYSHVCCEVSNNYEKIKTNHNASQ